MPLGGTAAEPRLELVTVPAAKVDWPATERSPTARASHYASTRGESDYARLTAEVAAALNKIAAAPDDRTRLQMAETMRRRVADWARESYGYRTFDISQISGMLDELVSGSASRTGNNDSSSISWRRSARRPPCRSCRGRPFGTAFNRL